MGARKRGGMEKMGARRRKKGAGLFSVGKRLYGMVPKPLRKELESFAKKEGTKLGKQIGNQILNKATKKIKGRRRK